MTPMSIEGLLAILRNTPSKTKQVITEPQKATVMRRSIRDKFDSYLQELKLEELDVLDRGFRGASRNMHEWVMNTVLVEYEDTAAAINATYRLHIQMMEAAKKSRHKGRRR